MPELKTSILYFTKLNKDDNSPVTYRPGVLSAIEKPTELADNSYLPLGGLFLFGFYKFIPIEIHSHVPFDFFNIYCAQFIF